jgi:hypothetical protein
MKTFKHVNSTSSKDFFTMIIILIIIKDIPMTKNPTIFYLHQKMVADGSVATPAPSSPHYKC